MSSTSEAVTSYRAALTEPTPERLASLAQWLDDDATVVGVVGPASGPAAIIEALAAPNATRLVSGASWSDSVEEDGEVVLEAHLPQGAAVTGVRFALRLGDDGKIQRVGQQMLMASPPEPQPLAITEEMKALIDGALANGTPIIAAYVDASGAPHLSPRGSTQVLNETQIGLWARDPEAGMPRGLAANPNLALYYRDPKSRNSLTITGKARVTTDPGMRERIWANQPAIERNIDGRMLGVGIVMDVEQIDAAGPAGRTKMVRT